MNNSGNSSAKDSIVSPPPRDNARTTDGTAADSSSASNVGDETSYSWNAELFFPVFYCNPNEPLPFNEMLYQSSNLFEFTRGFRGLGGMIARFNPATYPVVPGGMKNNRTTWKKLLSDIKSESTRSGKSMLVSNGSSGCLDRMVLICNNYKLYRERNRANCKAKLMIGVDACSFFLVCGIGNAVHTGHPPLCSEEIPTRKRPAPQEALPVKEQMSSTRATEDLQDWSFVENDSNKALPGARESARAEALPHVRNFLEAYAGIRSLETRTWARNEIDALTNKIKQIRLEEQGNAVGRGKGCTVAPP